MPYTLLKVTEDGVVLLDYHLRRLGLQGRGASRESFLRFAAEASPGVWAVLAEADGLRNEPRAGTRLRDGMPTRISISPVIGRATGAIAKTAPPCVYDSVRVDGVATLLTSADGAEVYEACCAAVVAYDGESIVCPPRDRPRVWSTAENAIREHLPMREAPIDAACHAILLVNAVKGSCALADPVSRSFPARVREQIDSLFARLTRRELPQ